MFLYYFFFFFLEHKPIEDFLNKQTNKTIITLIQFRIHSLSLSLSLSLHLSDLSNNQHDVWRQAQRQQRHTKLDQRRSNCWPVSRTNHRRVQPKSNQTNTSSNIAFLFFCPSFYTIYIPLFLFTITKKPYQINVLFLRIVVSIRASRFVPRYVTVSSALLSMIASLNTRIRSSPSVLTEKKKEERTTLCSCTIVIYSRC